MSREATSCSTPCFVFATHLYEVSSSLIWGRVKVPPGCEEGRKEFRRVRTYIHIPSCEGRQAHNPAREVEGG